MKAPGAIGFVLLFVGFSVTPAAANWFSNPYLGINRNIGSAPNPTPEQIRQERLGEHQLFSSYRGGPNGPDNGPSATSSQTGPYSQKYAQRGTDPTSGTGTQTGYPVYSSPGSF